MGINRVDALLFEMKPNYFGFFKKLNLAETPEYSIYGGRLSRAHWPLMEGHLARESGFGRVWNPARAGTMESNGFI